MKQYDSFTFQECDIDAAGHIALRYRLGDEVEFTESLQFPLVSELEIDSDVIAALQTLHLIGGASYWKAACPKVIQLESYELSPKQAEFWNTVYTKGMGEFFYRNNIDFRGLVNFPAEAETSSKPAPAGKQTAKRLLVPIGGGKDSLVTIELLKKAGYDVTLFRIGKHPVIEALARITGLPLLTVDRHLDADLFKLNAEGALNGHVPITAYNHAVAALVALLEGFDAVVFSNERSASTGNVQFHGQEVNHQWSKSMEFEKLFQNYLKEFVTNRVQTFSLLRPWSEVRIAQEFVKHPQYLPLATSCNTNWRIAGKKKIHGGAMNPNDLSSVALAKEEVSGSWCRSCPKCAFAFALYAAFLPAKDVTDIFGGNLFEDEKLLPTFRELLGVSGHKPFECVGTPEETRAAFLLARSRGDLGKSAAQEMFAKEVLPDIKNPDALIAEALAPANEHAMPEQFLSVLP